MAPKKKEKNLKRSNITGRYAACTGISTESEETSALIVIIPRLGIQSIRI